MFPVERVVPLLVHVLQRDAGPELMLLATRAIAYMVDSVPHAGRACVTHGAIPSLCEKLLTIEYIDLAEQSLQALEKLSVEFPDALVRGGGLMAALSYLDFFPTGFQRAALKTAKHMTRQLRPEHADLALDAVPLLINTVHHPDGKVSGLAGRGLGRERRRGRRGPPFPGADPLRPVPLPPPSDRLPRQPTWCSPRSWRGSPASPASWPSCARRGCWTRWCT